jgi:predicted nucleotidyltransferase
MTEFEILLQSHRGQILEAARRHGAYDVRVFGSVARGDARPDSDIDFLVAACSIWHACFGNCNRSLAPRLTL